jgi:hypothetical protein
MTVAAQWQHSWFADQTAAAIAGAVFWSQCRVHWKFSVCSTENLSWWQFVSLFLCYFVHLVVLQGKHFYAINYGF